MLPVVAKPCAVTTTVRSCGVPFWPAESCTLIVTGKEPLTRGVPESTPAGLSESPAGSAPVALHVSGVCPPVAEKMKLKGTFTAAANGFTARI